jgi:hypothetical protein
VKQRRAFEAVVHERRPWIFRCRGECHSDDDIADLAQRLANARRSPVTIYRVPAVRKFTDPPWPDPER